MMTLAELKEILKGNGFEVYRSRGAEVFLAERVRENLILDAGVSVSIATTTLDVSVTCRSERIHFAGKSDDAVFEHTASLGQAFLSEGFAEIERRSVAMTDPMNKERVLDTFFEILYRKAVASPEQAVETCRTAMAIPRTART